MSKWDVMRGSTVVCAGLDRHAAEMKVENERRIGWHMTVQPHAKIQAVDVNCYEEEDD